MAKRQSATQNRKDEIKIDKKTGRCNCIELVNDHLREHNTALATTFSLNAKRRVAEIVLPVPTRKIDSSVRKAAVSIMPSFCPFCGHKHPVEEVADDH